jgi:hypothetical protein
MSYSSFSDNDDDLFSESTVSNQKSFPQDIQSLIENVDSNISNDKVSSILSHSNIVINLLDSSNSFVFQTTSHTRTTFNTLNYLTNNKFQYDLYADILEESLFRKFLIFDFLNVCLKQLDESDYNIFNEITSLNIDRQFILTYFKSYHNLLDHSIEYNITLYKRLCTSIDRAPLEDIINRNLNSDYFSLISSNSYINSVFSNIKDTLLSSDERE